MNGAESETLNEMRRFLEYENSSKNSRSLTESSINEAFKTLMEKYKGSIFWKCIEMAVII